MVEYTFYKCLFSSRPEYNTYYEGLDYDPRNDPSDDYEVYYYAELSNGKCMYMNAPAIWQCDLIDGKYLLKEEYIDIYKWDAVNKLRANISSNYIDSLFEEQKKCNTIDITEIKYEELPAYARQLWEIYLKKNSIGNLNIDDSRSN